LRHSRYAEYFLGEGDLPPQKRKKAMSIRLPLIVATAIATLGLGSPAFAASYGGLSNDSGSMMSSYYDKTGWHVGLPPAARAALATPQQQSARPGHSLQLFAGRNAQAASSAGAMSGGALQ
jgi:hypothetical protein